NHPPWFIETNEIMRDNKPLYATEYSDIYRGVWVGKAQVVIKYMRNMADRDPSAVQEWLDTWYSLRHDHIVMFLGGNLDVIPPFIVTRYKSNGNILNYLQTLDWKEDKINHYVYSIANAIAYLHTRKIVHGDIRTANMLIDADGKVKLMFVFHETKVDEERLRWQAPELLVGDGPTASFPGDVYAFGCFVYELLSKGRVPFENIHTESLARHLNNGYHLEDPLDLTSSQNLKRLWDVAMPCWDLDPIHRP
ncbi:kinase-like domain-containing protein, partial [Polychytrium aggregatum]|uniref:kinase-like domain-containing protein n=1 Tax=Polychytrium aggregatum TaxID=110093 RepID=UPI0022FE9064